MAIDRFVQLLDQHGSDLGNWPDADNVLARELLQDSAEAKKHYEEQRILEEVLSSAPVPRAPKGLTGRIMKKIQTTG